jgi:type II secretory pathway pseudopilin PulG
MGAGARPGGGKPPSPDPTRNRSALGALGRDENLIPKNLFSSLAPEVVERRRRGQSGSGLIEAMVAVIIIGLTAVLLIVFLVRGHYWFAQEKEKREATLLAQESLERTVALPYDAIAAWEEERKVGSVNYEIQVAVVENTPDAGLKSVHATVTWSTGSTGNRNVSLATLVHPR